MTLDLELPAQPTPAAFVDWHTTLRSVYDPITNSISDAMIAQQKPVAGLQEAALVSLQKATIALESEDKAINQIAFARYLSQHLAQALTNSAEKFIEQVTQPEFMSKFQTLTSLDKNAKTTGLFDRDDDGYALRNIFVRLQTMNEDESVTNTVNALKALALNIPDRAVLPEAIKLCLSETLNCTFASRKQFLADPTKSLTQKMTFAFQEEFLSRIALRTALAEFSANKNYLPKNLNLRWSIINHPHHLTTVMSAESILADQLTALALRDYNVTYGKPSTTDNDFKNKTSSLLSNAVTKKNPPVLFMVLDQCHTNILKAGLSPTDTQKALKKAESVWRNTTFEHPDDQPLWQEAVSRFAERTRQSTLRPEDTAPLPQQHAKKSRPA